MKKQITFVAIAFGIIVVILLAIIGYNIYNTPRPVDTAAFPLTVTMTKLDANGNTLSTCKITIEGQKLKYLSGKECLDVEITGLPGVDKIEADEATDGITGEIMSYPGRFEWQTVSCSKWPGFGFVSLMFSPDLDRWALSSSTGDPFYVGSVSGKYTPQELAEYFCLD